jgi:hypothetical protein
MTDSRRIVGLIFIPEDKQPEAGGITCIINYTFNKGIENNKEMLIITEISVYCAYPAIVRNTISQTDLSSQCREEIWNIEGMSNVDFQTKTVTIL